VLACRLSSLLQHLDLQSNCVGYADANRLAVNLCHHPTLRLVDLRHHELYPAEVVQTVETFALSTTLQVLRVGDVLSGLCDTTEAAVSWTDVTTRHLGSNVSVQRGDGCMDDVLLLFNCVCVCGWVRAQTSLVELHMGNCGLTGLGSAYVLDCIRKNVSASVTNKYNQPGLLLTYGCVRVHRHRPSCVTSTC